MGYISDADSNNPYYIDPYSGAPIGISNTSWNNGSYVRNAQGTPVYVGYQPTMRDYNPGWVGAGNSSLENQKFITQDRAEAQYDYDRQNLLRNSNIAQVNWNDQQQNKMATIPGYTYQSYDKSPEYSANKTASQNLTGAFQKTLADLQLKLEQDAAKRDAEQQALLRAQAEAAKRINMNDNANARQSIIENRMIALRNANPNMSQAEIEASVDRTFKPLTLDYLDSLKMVASKTGGAEANGGVTLYGIGSSNFNPATGNFAISDQQRQELQQFREDLQNHKYDNEIAKGYFSPSGTGIEGLDGKPIQAQTMVKGGQLYQNDASGNWGTASTTNTAPKTANQSGVSQTGALDSYAYGSSQAMVDAINKALGAASSATQPKESSPVQATGGRAQNTFASSGAGASYTPRTSGIKETVISNPKVTYSSTSSSKPKTNTIRYA